MTKPAVLLTALLALPAAAAHAEPYPTVLSDRPLLLPSNVGEAGAELRMQRYSDGEDLGLEPFDRTFTELSLRGGLGPVELRADASLYVAPPEGQEHRLYRVGVGAGMAVAPDAAVTAHFSRLRPQADGGLTTIDGAYLVRLEASERTAVLLGGGARYDLDDTGGSTYIAWAEGHAGGQAQLHDQFGIDARVRLSVPFADSYPDDIFYYGPDTQLRVAVRGVATLPHLDLYLGAELTPTMPIIGAERTVTAGMIGRLQ